MQDLLVNSSIQAPRFGAATRLHPLNPALISNQPTSTDRALIVRAALLAN